jgi:hypothetical protein
MLSVVSSFASQIYSPNTSLSTHCLLLHLQNTPGHLEEYLAAVEKYGFKNKLPMELAGQVAED